MDELVLRDITPLIPPDAGKRRGTRPGWNGGLYDFMRRALAGDIGAHLYAKRKAMIEPVFANTKFNRGIDRFARRGRSACRSEWRLITATHNLLKLHTHQTRARSRLKRGRAAAEPLPRRAALPHQPAAPLRRRPPNHQAPRHSATATSRSRRARRAATECWPDREGIVARRVCSRRDRT